MKRESFRYEYVPHSTISLHPDIPQNILIATSSLRNRVGISDAVSAAGIDYLLQLHPVHVIAKKNEAYVCIGGLRSYQI